MSGVRARLAPLAAAVLLASGTIGAQRAPDRATLRRDIDAVMAAPLLSRSHWSIRVKSLDRGDVIYEQNPRKLVMPASNMKVFTMAGAAERLGWDHRFETTLETGAPIADGMLQGDLVVRGSGDPTIALRDDVAVRAFDDWARQLRDAGVSTIAGRIVGNDDAMEDEELGNGWAWDDLGYGYAAPVTALVFNESLVRVNARPGTRAGDPALIEVVPAAGHGLTIVNRVTTGEATEPESFAARRARGSPELELVGRVPMASEPVATLTASVENPTLYFARSLRSALIARGIRVEGDAADQDLLPPWDAIRSARPLRVLARHRSAPLTDIGRTFMKVSQNLYGELLVKSIGSGTTAEGQRAVRETLDRWGVPRDGYILADGSGLSRLNFVSADALVTILEHLYADPRHREPFLQVLPVGGTDGTLRNRLRASWTAGNVHAKTGSITNVRALSGYLKTRSGEMLVFSIVANNFSLPAWRIERVIDLIVEIAAR